MGKVHIPSLLLSSTVPQPIFGRRLATVSTTAFYSAKSRQGLGLWAVPAVAALSSFSVIKWNKIDLLPKIFFNLVIMDLV